MLGWLSGWVDGKRMKEKSVDGRRKRWGNRGKRDWWVKRQKEGWMNGWVGGVGGWKKERINE